MMGVAVGVGWGRGPNPRPGLLNSIPLPFQQRLDRAV